VRLFRFATTQEGKPVGEKDGTTQDTNPARKLDNEVQNLPLP